jgi:hypothetical protein
MFQEKFVVDELLAPPYYVWGALAFWDYDPTIDALHSLGK